MQRTRRANVANAILKTKRRPKPMAVIIRDKPPTYDWGWFSREDPRMHLQAVDKDHRDLHYKVWLEERGRKAFVPEPGIPSKVLRALQTEVAKQRGRIEAYWIAFMIKKGWLRVQLRNGVITLQAYPNSPNHFERVINLSHIISNGDVARKISAQDVVLNEEYAVLEIFPRREEAARVHERLEDVLWQA